MSPGDNHSSLFWPFVRDKGKKSFITSTPGDQEVYRHSHRERISGKAGRCERHLQLPGLKNEQEQFYNKNRYCNCPLLPVSLVFGRLVNADGQNFTFFNKKQIKRV